MAEELVGYLFATDELIATSGTGRAAHLVAKAMLPTGFRVRTVDDDERFERVVNELAPENVPPPAWLLQARRNAILRDEFLRETGALSADDLADLAGSTAANRRATAHRWSRDSLVFSVNHHGRSLYPGFQIDPASGQPKAVIAQVLKALPPGLRHGGWQLALWWGAPSASLAWKRPLDVLDFDADLVIEAARAEARAWAEANPNPVEPNPAAVTA